MKSLETELKQLIIDALELEDIAVDDIVSSEPLFNDGLCLDSIDALELGVALQKRYGIKLNAKAEETKRHFASVSNLALFVESQRQDRDWSMKSRDEIYRKVTAILVDLFEIDSNSVSEDALLYDDLDIDSIDAIDLIIELKSYTGKKVPPEEFKSIKTVGDIVDKVFELLAHD